LDAALEDLGSSMASCAVRDEKIANSKIISPEPPVSKQIDLQNVDINNLNIDELGEMVGLGS
jgi:hypothetical protein